MDRVKAQMRWKLFAYAVIYLTLCIFNVAQASVTVIQSLDFGSYIVKRNDAQYDITVNHGGVVSYSSTGFVQISGGQPGIYDIDGLPANSVINSVVMTQIDPLQGVTGEVFQLVNFDYMLHSGSTSAGGVVRLSLGATARTSGNGNPYASQNFLGVIQIQINF